MKVKMNVNFFGMPEPKTNVNSDTQEIPIELPHKETVTLQNENEKSRFTNSPLANDPTNSIANERPKRICRSPAYLKNYES